MLRTSLIWLKKGSTSRPLEKATNLQVPQNAVNLYGRWATISLSRWIPQYGGGWFSCLTMTFTLVINMTAKHMAYFTGWVYRPGDIS
jgi:hypothetical protein